MSNATETTVSVSFDTNATSLQSDIIMAASANKAGVMTAAMFLQLASLVDLTPAVIADILVLIAELPPATVTALTNMLAVFTASGGAKIFSNTSRPPANDPQFADALSAGRVAEIWNSSDHAPNYSDGVNWYDAAGNLT